MDLFLAVLCSLLVSQLNAEGVYLTYSTQELAVPNHGFVLLTQINSTLDSALNCRTDKLDCCSSNDTGGRRLGNWFFPNGTAIAGRRHQFYVTRKSQVIRLSQKSAGVLMVPGVYCCRVPNAQENEQELCVGIYTSESGRPIITSIQFEIITSELNVQSPTFTLTCISEGGPVEEVEWRKNGILLLQDYTTYNMSTPTVVNRESATYRHTLTVTGNLPGRYTCHVISNRSLTGEVEDLHTSNLTVNVMVVYPVVRVSAENAGNFSAVQVAWLPSGTFVIETTITIDSETQCHEDWCVNSLSTINGCANVSNSTTDPNDANIATTLGYVATASTGFFVLLTLFLIVALVLQTRRQRRHTGTSKKSSKPGEPGIPLQQCTAYKPTIRNTVTADIEGNDYDYIRAES